MRTWDRCRPVAMGLTITNDLYDRTRLEIVHPTRVATMEPRGSPIVHDPEARLEPGAVRLLGAKNNHLSPNLDEGPVSRPIENQDRGCGRKSDGESLHEEDPLGIARAVQRTGH